MSDIVLKKLQAKLESTRRETEITEKAIELIKESMEEDETPQARQERLALQGKTEAPGKVTGSKRGVYPKNSIRFKMTEQLIGYPEGHLFTCQDFHDELALKNSAGAFSTSRGFISHGLKQKLYRDLFRKTEQWKNDMCVYVRETQNSTAAKRLMDKFSDKLVGEEKKDSPLKGKPRVFTGATSWTRKMVMSYTPGSEFTSSEVAALVIANGCSATLTGIQSIVSKFATEKRCGMTDFIRVKGTIPGELRSKNVYERTKGPNE